jgi:excinuclease ABC subunit A
VYILDEPTTGLSLADVHQLIEVLLRLRRNSHTVIIIEHHLDVIKCADWVLDLGPEGGEQGGLVVAEGTPEEITENPDSYTGKHLLGFV